MRIVKEHSLMNYYLGDHVGVGVDVRIHAQLAELVSPAQHRLEVPVLCRCNVKRTCFEKQKQTM